LNHRLRRDIRENPLIGTMNTGKMAPSISPSPTHSQPPQAGN
jgi:hypothetical protein